LCTGIQIRKLHSTLLKRILYDQSIVTMYFVVERSSAVQSSPSPSSYTSMPALFSGSLAMINLRDGAQNSGDSNISAYKISSFRS
jgi:hypothetical protein